MSKNKKESETKAEEIKKVSAETLVVDVKSVPSTMSFEEMQKAVAEFKKLQKIIKALPKEERAKLLPPVKARELPESLKNMADQMFTLIDDQTSAIEEEFLKTVTVEKPDGNKSISLTIPEAKYSVAIIRKSKKGGAK